VTRRPARAIMPLALVALTLPGHAASAAQPAAPTQPGCIVPVPVLCPSPSPTPAPSASSSPSPAPSADPTPSAGASPTGSPTPDPSPSASGSRRKASSVKAAVSAGLQVSEAQFTLVTGSALLLGASYQGVAQVPTASGKAVPIWSSP
jgi:hypothetical protein